MDRLLVNYHTHTHRCGHATGEDREFIESAIAGGIKVLGFSDHSPMVFPSGYESGFRVPVSKAADYFESLTALKEEYRDEIEIHIGVEVEYFPASFDDYLAFIGRFPCEYFICGQHFIWDEEKGNSSFRPTQSEEILASYFDNLIEAVKSERFLYIAHPDLINYTGDAEIYRRHALRFLEVAKEYAMPLEINRLGLEEGRQYPNDLFWQCAAETGNRAIIGIDAHSPGPLSDTAMHRKCIEYAEKAGVELITGNLLK
ncbi:MAG: histidinol-phosphatase [Clostridia bacterium]|nr:histidinol-phosphatase [Clostridia bacterium]